MAHSRHKPASPGATPIGSERIEAADKALIAAGVPATERPALLDLLSRWRWNKSDPNAQLEELLVEVEHWQLYLEAYHGDERAGLAFTQHWRSYARAALRWRLPIDELDDLTAAFFARIYRLIGDTYAWRSPFTVYLCTTMLNLARTHGRRLGVRASREVTLDDRVEAGAVHATATDALNPEESVLREERRQRIEAILFALPPLDRFILVGALVDGKSGQELAEELSMGREAVYKRLQRGRRKLRQLLERDGLMSESRAAGSSPGRSAREEER